MFAKSVLLLILLTFIDCSFQQKCSDVSINHRIDCTPDKPNDPDVCHQRKCCFSSEKHNSTHTFNCIEIASGFPHDIKDISIAITFLNDKSLRIRAIDKNEDRFEPPIPQLSLPEFPVALDPLYEVEVSSEGVLAIQRKSNKRVIFATDLTKLVFSDQFIQMKTSLSSNKIYGLGEHKTSFLKDSNWKKYTLFNDGSPGRLPPDYSLYGSHPFYLNVEDSNGSSNAVFLRNSNAMDVLLQPEPAITWRPIGGVIDMFVFLGPKPDEAVQEYINLIGRPAMPPFWGLGYHQCRCCKSPHTLEEQKAITERTIKADIPFDVQWNAKEYMIQFNDFTVDNNTFGGFGDFVRHLHDIGMHYVPIIDPGIDPAQPAGTYPPYDDGVKLDIFIKNASNKILIGKMWNKSGKTVWPDFSHPSATPYWTKQFKDFHKMVPIDGAWNDMNEIANSGHGSLQGCPKNSSLENPPYRPGPRTLNAGTLCMTAKHYVGLHYNVHNLYAFYMAIATNHALREVRQKRPFIISRASSPGLGKYAGHWDGDTDTSYVEMAWTIPSIMNFNMYGIPLVGGDICGFTGKANNDSNFQEMCSRWLEIGAFYPFSRNHNEKHVDQDPVSLGTTVVMAAKNALRLRYSLLPYLYTLFFMAASRGDTVARPLFFVFPNDNNSYGEVSESQFMWGKAFMVVPVIKPNQTTVNAYFPSGRWYAYSLDLNSKPLESKGQFQQLDAPIGKVNTFIRGGHVVPVLPPKQTTTQMRKENFTIIVALDEMNNAHGQLYWDDGDSLDPIHTQRYSLISFKANNGTLTTEAIHHKYEQNIILDNMSVLGLKTRPNSVSVNGHNISFKYDSDIQKLTIDGKLGLSLVNAINNIVWK